MVKIDKDTDKLTFSGRNGFVCKLHRQTTRQTITILAIFAVANFFTLRQFLRVNA